MMLILLKAKNQIGYNKETYLPGDLFYLDEKYPGLKQLLESKAVVRVERKLKLDIKL